mgnify:CR=1 FL=1
MADQRRFIVAGLVGKQFNGQAALFVREQRHFQVVNRPGRQSMGNGANALKIELIIKDLNICLLYTSPSP